MDREALAWDLASFHNTTVAQARSAINAVFLGEYDPIRKYGVVIRGRDLEYELMTQTMDAHGDFERTRDSYGNRNRLAD